MFYMACFVRLAMLGAVLTRFTSCSFGSPFCKPFQWLHKKPWLTELAGTCTCEWKGAHLVIGGSFSPEALSTFHSRCRPSAKGVFGRDPVPGEPLAAFSASYPLPLVRRMAAGSAQAKRGQSPVLPLSQRFSTLETLRTSGLGFSGLEVEAREFFDDPEWIGELAESLPFRELLRYRFKGKGHINVLEGRAYKTWLKWCSTRHFTSCATVLCGCPRCEIDGRGHFGSRHVCSTSCAFFSKHQQGDR